MSFKSWVFTIFTDAREWYDTFKPGEEFQYISFQLEECPLTGKEHVQGMLQLKTKTRMRTVKALILRDDAHLEVLKSIKGSFDYVHKEQSRVEAPVEFGKLIGQGQRTDIVMFRDRIGDGVSNYDLMMEMPREFFTYNSMLEKCREAFLEEKGKTERELQCSAIIGKPGVGKTRAVYDRYGEQVYRPVISGERIWFPKYRGQEVLLLDDYYGQLPLHTLLHICDRYPLTVETKGGFTHAVWTRVLFTSNVHMEAWYPEKDITALKRRVREVILHE